MKYLNGRWIQDGTHFQDVADDAARDLIASPVTGQIVRTLSDGYLNVYLTSWIKQGTAPVPPTNPVSVTTGFELANATDTDHDISIGTGSCLNAAGNASISTSTAIVKQVDTAWAQGTDAGGLDTGAIGASTTYHCYAITKNSDATVDFMFSLTYGSPSPPAGWTLERWVGAIVTDESANIRQFKQYGNNVFFTTKLGISTSVSVPGTATNIYSHVPTGLSVLAFIHQYGRGKTGLGANQAGNISLGSPIISDSSYGYFMCSSTVVYSDHLQLRYVLTDTSGNIQHWKTGSVSTLGTYDLYCLGWVYTSR